jgi:hypothetical protein
VIGPRSIGRGTMLDTAKSGPASIEVCCIARAGR